MYSTSLHSKTRLSLRVTFALERGFVVCYVVFLSSPPDIPARLALLPAQHRPHLLHLLQECALLAVDTVVRYRLRNVGPGASGSLNREFAGYHRDVPCRDMVGNFLVNRLSNV